MRDNITGKSILLIGDPFYGYCYYIKDQLLLLGAKYVYYVELPFYYGSFRDSINLTTLLYWLKDPQIRTHWTNKLKKEIDGKTFDTFFVIEKMPFSKSFLDYLRAENPHIRTILFLWDTFRTQQSRYLDYLPLFDKVYTFDKDDASKYHLSYFPDFYIEEKNVPVEQCKYDLAFVGTMDPACTAFRGNLLAKIDKACISEKLNCFFYLRYYDLDTTKGVARKWYKRIVSWRYYRMIGKLKNHAFMKNTALPLHEYNKIMANTKAILDINHHNRQGMTINVITALANGKKLITTNERIKEETFYDPQMISIIDQKLPVIDFDLLRSPYKKIDISYLRIDNWLKHVVNEL